ncbi:hypothetical protein ENUP19_0044G0002 [Entamoeba nuttalli]|uniref:Reverse transcriptase domain-containing protein n=1 Tax=Entamoeba nuttalli TaxID=412467 RepID=A0ABQ0DAF9_9EUKA
MEEEIIKHQLKDKELKEIISKMNKKEEIEEDEEMKIFKEEEMKEQEDVQFINYYYNKKKVHQIINIINKNEIIINTLDDYYHYIKSVSSIINIINKNKQERSGKKSIERILHILYILNNTYLNLYYNQESVGMINVERGIIQSDSLSPLLFVLSIDILSKQLDKQISKLNIKMNGEEKQIQLNHILYIEDLKIMTNSLDEMEKAHKLTKEIFN